MTRPKNVPDAEAEEFAFKKPGEDPAYDAWFREQVQEGLDQIDREEIVPDETVRAKWRKRRAELLHRAAEIK